MGATQPDLPWRIEERAETRYRVVNAVGGIICNTPFEDEACLVVASPELLAFCREFIQLRRGGWGFWIALVFVPRLACLLAKCGALITKAEGAQRT